MIRRLWHNRFGHVWDLVAHVENGNPEPSRVDFIRCACGAMDKLEHTWEHTAIPAAIIVREPR